MRSSRVATQISSDNADNASWNVQKGRARSCAAEASRGELHSFTSNTHGNHFIRPSRRRLLFAGIETRLHGAGRSASPR